jgi:hypothetical protein
MATKKITELPVEAGALTADMLGVCVEDPAGTPTTKSFTFDKMRNFVLGIAVAGAIIFPEKSLSLEGAAAIDGSAPITVQVRSTTNSSSWTDNAVWGRFGFWSNDISGIGSALRAAVDAYTVGTTGSVTGIRIVTSSGSALVTAAEFAQNNISFPLATTFASTVAITGVQTNSSRINTYAVLTMANWRASDGSVDAREWSWRVDSSGNMGVRSVLDNNTTVQEYLRFTRTGTFLDLPSGVNMRVLSGASFVVNSGATFTIAAASPTFSNATSFVIGSDPGGSHLLRVGGSAAFTVAGSTRAALFTSDQASAIDLISVRTTAAASGTNFFGMDFRANSSTQERSWFQIQVTTSTTTDASRNSLVAFASNASGTFAPFLSALGTVVTIPGTLTQNETTANLVQSATTSTLAVGTGIGSGATSLDIRGAAGQWRVLRFRTGTLARWQLRMDGATESGANAGSDLRVEAYDDAGSFIDAVLLVNRVANGAITFASARPITGGTYNGNTLGATTVAFPSVTAFTIGSDPGSSHLLRVGGSVNILSKVDVGTLLNTGFDTDRSLIAHSGPYDTQLGTLTLFDRRAQGDKVGPWLVFRGFNDASATVARSWYAIGGEKNGGSAGSNNGRLAFYSIVNTTVTERGYMDHAGEFNWLYELRVGSASVVAPNTLMVTGPVTVQARIRYDASDYLDIGVASGGEITFTGTASGTTIFNFLNGPLNVTSPDGYQINGNKVLGARRSGWGIPTGTLTRTTFVTSTVTTAQLAERVAALLNDLHASGASATHHLLDS